MNKLEGSLISPGHLVIPVNYIRFTCICHMYNSQYQVVSIHYFNHHYSHQTACLSKLSKSLSSAETVVCLQVKVAYSVSYTGKGDIPACASIVKVRFEDIGGSLRGAQALAKIEPTGRAKLTVFNIRTNVYDFKCPEGELLQHQQCGKFSLNVGDGC